MWCFAALEQGKHSDISMNLSYMHLRLLGVFHEVAHVCDSKDPSDVHTCLCDRVHFTINLLKY